MSRPRQGAKSDAESRAESAYKRRNNRDTRKGAAIGGGDGESAGLASRIAYLEAAATDFGRLAVKAEKAGRFSAAIAARRAELDARAELDTLRAVHAAERQPRTPREEVRALRLAAAAASSYVAAGRLLQLERELEEQEQRRADEAAEAELRGKSDEELLEEARSIAAELGVLPPS